MVQTSTQTIVVGGRVRAPLALSTDLVLRGTVAAIVGLVTVGWPSESLDVMRTVFAVGAFAVGVCELVDVVRRRHFAVEWGLGALRGLLLVGGGIYLLASPDLTLSQLATVVGGGWAAYGAIEAAEGFRARRGVREARFRVTRGVVMAAGAVVALAWPDASTVVLGRSIGVALVLMGVLCVPSALVLRQVGQLQRPIRLDVVR